MPILSTAARVICATVVLLAGALQAHAAGGLFDLEWKELAPGIHVGQRADPMRYPVVCNTVIVIGSDGVLVSPRATSS